MVNSVAASACALAALIATAAPAPARAAEPLSALARMPVREVTVFKDGHAFVLHEGKMPTDARGRVLLDYLPAPVVGTFWPYSAERDVKLRAVTASRRRVRVEKTALATRELVEANPGAEVRVAGTDKESWDGKVVGVPTRSAEEVEATSPPGGGDKLAEKGSVVLLETAGGVVSVSLDQIRNVTFKGAYRTALASEEYRSLLALDLDWPGGERRAEAQVGMVYLQKGLRWIPGYKVTIDGAGKAQVRLQATLVNELADLEDVTANLVIGVPTFAFKDTPDPISLQDVVAQLGPHFDANSATGYAFTNAVMSQQMGRLGGGLGDRADAEGGGGGARPGLGPDVAGGGKDEDLFVFTVRHVSLAKGARMVLPVAEYALEYKDVYTLDIPFAPPAEVRTNVGEPQQEELRRLLAAPKPLHVLRIANHGTEPLTTAPALITSGDHVLGQGTMTYTPPGAAVDLPVTAAVDLQVKRKDVESGRTPSALTVQGTAYARIDLTGKISITSRRDKPVDLEVTRRVLGHADKADAGGRAEMLSAFDQDAAGAGLPPWWNWYSWPGWWHNVNGNGRFTWKVRIEPGKSVDLGYGWHYFWP